MISLTVVKYLPKTNRASILPCLAKYACSFSSGAGLPRGMDFYTWGLRLKRSHDQLERLGEARDSSAVAQFHQDQQGTLARNQEAVIAV